MNSHSLTVNFSNIGLCLYSMSNMQRARVHKKQLKNLPKFFYISSEYILFSVHKFRSQVCLNLFHLNSYNNWCPSTEDAFQQQRVVPWNSFLFPLLWVTDRVVNKCPVNQIVWCLRTKLLFFNMITTENIWSMNPALKILIISLIITC
jgi:hypothetical protein